MKNPSDIIDELIKHPEVHNEAVLDGMIAAGGVEEDYDLIWSFEVQPGCTVEADLTKTAVVLGGKDKGPTPGERAEIKASLRKGDRLSTLSGPGMWVVRTSRTKGLRCWARPVAGVEEADPALPECIMGNMAVFRLTERGHLAREGRLLNHCVGLSGSGYYRKVESGESQIYSVRRQDGQDWKPVCTVELSGGMVVQSQGRGGSRLEDNEDARKTWDAWLNAMSHNQKQKGG